VQKSSPGGIYPIWEVRVRKLLVSLMVVSALAGPFASLASASPAGCRLAEKLGVVWVKECE
jgi:hypothetical protein